MLAKLEVGKQYPTPDVIGCDGAWLQIDGYWIMVTIICTNLSKEEIHLFNRDPISISFVDFDNIMFFVCNPGKFITYEIPFSVSLYPSDIKNEILSVSPDRYPILFVLVENLTLTVEAIRTVNLDLEFSAKIKEAISKQVPKEICETEYINMIHAFYEKYKTPEEITECATAKFVTERGSNDMTEIQLIV